MGHTRKLGYLPPCVAGGWVPLLAHFFILYFLSFSAFAQESICYEYKVSTTSDPNATWHTTQSAACSAEASWSTNTRPGYEVSFTATAGPPDLVCTYRRTPQGGATTVGTWNLARRTRACEQVCEPGPKGAVNFTVGYHATSSTNLALNPLAKADPFWKQLEKDRGGTMCHEGCKVGISLPDEGAQPYISQVAGENGLYRSSAELDIQGTSQRCSESPPDSVNPTSTPPACDGTLGTVKLSPVCLPSTVESGIDLSGLGEAIRGNPTAGKVDPSKTTAQKAAGPGGTGNGTSPTGANGGGPTGGPATGTNNGSTGKGCNDGSKSPAPACSGKGDLDSDGTTDKPGEDKEQQACGAPGQPKCRIDETGTPDGKSAFDSSKDKLNSEFDKLTTELDKIKSSDGKDTSWGVMPSWIQTGGCSPWNLGTIPYIDKQITIDICAIKPYVDGVMNFLWALGTFFAVISMVFRVTTNTSS